MRHLLIFISLFSGLFIYLGYRNMHTPIYQWTQNLGFENELSILRNFAQGFTLPDWFIYSAPDGLWMFSFVMSMLSIWNFKLNNTSGKWMLSAILVGLGFELLQIIYRKLGVFDFNDLFIMLVSAAFTLMFFSNKKTPDIQVETNKYQSKQTEVIKI